MVSDMNQSDLLKKLDEVPHVLGRSLRQHGESVAAILNQWQMPSEVILAGLYHSVYGRAVTRFVPVLSLEDRKCMVDIVGVIPERLIFLNCFYKIDSFWNLFHKSEKDNLALESYVVGLDLSLTWQELVFLLHINLANILDHIDHDAPLSHFKSGEISLYLQYSNILFDLPKEFFLRKFSANLDIQPNSI